MSMNSLRIIVAMLVALTLAISIPGVSLAQSGQSSQLPAYQSYVAGPAAQVASPNQIGQTGRPIPQPKGGIATVVGVDQPENCLRIRSGPGSEYDIIGCAALGQQLNITGVWTSNNWAQLADNGWVYGPQIQTDLRAPLAAYSRAPSYVVTEEVTPDYGDWAYLPDYGYDTYWYGGIPIFFYNIGVWYRYHPWWWHRGHQTWWWKDGHHGRRAWNAAAFNNYVRAGTNRNFATNRSNISSPNITRFNTNRFGSGSTKAFRSRTFSSPNTFRSGSANAFRSRSFSSPHFSTRSFSGPSFRARSFSSPARMGSVGARSFSIGRMGGGRAFRGGFGGHRR